MSEKKAEKLKIDPKTLLIDVLYDIIGSVLYGAGMYTFAVSSNFAPGGVFIGMHMRPVCVPIHNENTKICCANVTMARNRPKLIGGERAQY